LLKEAALGAAKAALLERLTEAQVRERATHKELETLRARVEILVGAERTCASDLARLNNEMSMANAAKSREVEERKQLRAALERSRQEAQKHASALAQVTAELAAAQATAEALAETRQELERVRQQAQSCALDNARLAGQLEALQARSPESGK
jgi:hypothetical protein